MRFLIINIFLLLLSCNSNKDIVVKEGYAIRFTLDGVKQADYFYSDSKKLYKINEYFQNGSLENVIIFEFTDNILNSVFTDTIKKLKDDWLTNYYQDIVLYNDYLNKNGINIDNCFLISNEIKDFNNLHINIDNFMESSKNDIKIFKAKDLNLKIRFTPSFIEKFIPLNSEINEFEYGLNNQKYLIYEKIKFNDGLLKIDYKYNSIGISEITYDLKYNNGEILRSVKKFKFIGT